MKEAGTLFPKDGTIATPHPQVSVREVVLFSCNVESVQQPKRNTELVL